MSIEVDFYKNFAKKSNSTKVPVSPATYDKFDCTLKDGCKITTPEIEVFISGDPASLGYTYAYIPSFSRYYFVNEWTYRRGLWTASLTVDVLASFKTNIGNFSPYVLRASGITEDDSVPDSLYPASNSWTSAEISIPDMFDMASGSYVIGFICPPSGTLTLNVFGAVTYYYATLSDLQQLIRYMLSTTFVNTYLKDDATGLTEAAVKDFVNPLDYIASLTYFPFDTIGPGIHAQKRPQIGFWDTSNDSNVPLLNKFSSLNCQFTGTTYSVDIPTNPNAANAGKAFLKYPPYVEYDLLFEPFGVIPLNGHLMVGRQKLYLSCDVDIVTGNGRLSVGTQAGRADLGIYNAMVGVPVALAQITQDVINTGFSALETVGNVVGSVATGHWGTAAAQIMGGIQSTVNSMKPYSQTKGINGSLLAYQGLNTGATLIFRYCNCVGVDVNEFGYACNKALSTISSYPGYVQCANDDITLSCLDEEREMIGNYLTGGFFYE